MSPARARPSRATAVRDAFVLMAETGVLPTGRLAEQVRRAYARGTLDPMILDLLRVAGAGDMWLAPRRSALARNLASVVGYIVMTGQIPRAAQRTPDFIGPVETEGAAGGRWLRDLRAAALAAGPDSAEQQLLDAIARLAVSVVCLGARR